jgi:hypothetical protein
VETPAVPAAPIDHQRAQTGLLNMIHGELKDMKMLAELAAEGGRRFKRCTWQAASFSGYKDGKAAEGFWIFNDGGTDAYLAQSADRTTASGALLTIKAGTWVALPLQAASIFLGGPAAGSAVVVAFDHAPTPASGPTDAALDHPYAKGKTHNAVSIAGGGGQSLVALGTAGFNYVTLLARMTASAQADLSLVVFAFEDDDTTPYNVGWNPDFVTMTAVLVSGISYVGHRHLLGGIDQVRVLMQNNNAVAQTGTCIYFLQK